MVKKRDKHGEYKTDAGSVVPVDEDDVGYVPCNAVLKFTWERYDEVRYCTGMAEVNFNSEDGLPFCKHHKSRQALMDQHHENFKTGAFVESYADLFDYLPAHKRVVAIELFRDLLEDSRHDFDVEELELTIDLTDADWYDADEEVTLFPVAQDNTTRAKALWFVALDFVRMESIEEQIFEDAFTSDMNVGEREVVITVTEDGREITDRDEHHLNLPLSRIMKDYKNHLQYGGVAFDKDDEASATTVEKQWVVFDAPESVEEEDDGFVFPEQEEEHNLSNSPSSSGSSSGDDN